MRARPVARPRTVLSTLRRGLQSNWPILIAFSLVVIILLFAGQGPSSWIGEGGRSAGEAACECPPAEQAQQGDAEAQQQQLEQLGQFGPGGAPRICRLGLPEASSASSSSSSSSNGGSGSGSGSRIGGAAEGDGGQAKHKLAVLIPYRDRESHLSTLLSKLHPYLTRRGIDFDILILEQGDSYLFNRGALLNAGALLLEGSHYDYYVFQDVDTIPKEDGGIEYRYPGGDAPLHITPFGVHPKANYEDFFGGIVIYTRQQLQRVNGFGTQFWGWGREDDNMRERLVRAGLWPPELPGVEGEPQQLKKLRPGGSGSRENKYFIHQGHEQAAELRGQEVNGSMVFFQEKPNRPYKGAKIMSSQPNLLQDFATGLNTTQFRLLAVKPFAEAVKYTVELYCDTAATPWCLPSAIGQRPGAVKRGHHVHAVASGII